MGIGNERIAKWDARYAAGEGRHGFVPSPPLPAAVAGLAPGRALDVAAGAGRHAIYLAERGWNVVAVEGSAEADRVMREEAERRGLLERIESRLVDLETPAHRTAIEREGYDLVCDFYFLERTLFPALLAAVRPGGLLVAAIHVYGSGAANHAFLLAPGELALLVEGPSWEVLHTYEGPSRDGGHDHATAELIARKRIVTKGSALAV